MNKKIIKSILKILVVYRLNLQVNYPSNNNNYNRMNKQNNKKIIIIMYHKQ